MPAGINGAYPHIYLLNFFSLQILSYVNGGFHRVLLNITHFCNFPANSNSKK